MSRAQERVEQTVTIDGHEVRWVYYAYDHGDRGIFDGHTVECSCNDRLKELAAEGKIPENYSNAPEYGVDPDQCIYRKAACKLQALKGAEAIDAWMGERTGRSYFRMRGNLHHGEWAEMEFMETFRRMQAGEWLGQTDDLIYYQYIAEVMSYSPRAIAALADKLFREKKIGLTGAIVSEYDPERDEPRDDDDTGLDDSKPPDGESITGKLFLFSETGTEGGLWALHADGKDGYDGLRILDTGDYLRVYGGGEMQHESLVWEGYVRLRHYNLFTEDARGFWIHADQRGVERDTWAGWFFDGLSAEVIKKS